VLAQQSKHDPALEAYRKAIEAIEEALGFAPNDVGFHSNKGNALQGRAALLAQQSKHDRALEAYEEAIEAYEEALDLAPDHVEAHNNKGNALQGRARLLAQLSEHDRALEAYQEAIEAYDRALSLNRDYPQALYSKARALLNRGKLLLRDLRMGLVFGKRPLRAAQNLYNRVLQIAPSYTSARKRAKEVSKLIEEIEDKNGALAASSTPPWQTSDWR
jgi:tetratricopeptide (TPR) repeat protein